MTGWLIGTIILAAELFFIVSALQKKYYRTLMIVFTILRLFLIIITLMYLFLQGKANVSNIAYNVGDGIIAIAFPFIIKYIYNKRIK